MITIYTDGACSGNPGPGGWAAVLQHGSNIKEVSGYEAMTTNQRMELMAVIEALKTLKVTDWEVKVHTDSAYVVNAFEKGWIENWQRNGWVNSKKEPVANQDLWVQLIRKTRENKVQIIKVAGHKGVPMNERCDQLARQAIKDNQKAAE